MSQLWMFSPSSEPYLQRCINAALLQDNDNKWNRQFGRKITKKLDNTQLLEDKTPVEIIKIDTPNVEEVKNNIPVACDDFFDTIENEIRLDFVAKECSKNPDLMVKMAERLPANTVDKLFNLIFSSENVNTGFLNAIFLTFLPSYLKQENRISIDLLVKTSEHHPELFQKLLKILLRDTEIPNNLMYNYISSQDNDICSRFLENIANCVMSAESFIHNLSTIEMAYTHCIKTDKIQDCIRFLLLKHGEKCATDRNYGRLFMLYLQAEKTFSNKINVKQMEDCLENHASPFKRPCLTLLKEFKNE